VRLSLTDRTVRTATSVLALAALSAVPGPAHAGARPEVDVYDLTVNETVLAPTAILKVRLAEKAKSPVTVTWRTVDGTAKAGSDYVAASGKVVFAPGQRAKKVKIAVGDDDRPETDEFFYVAFASKQARVTTKRATVSIIDDDVPAYTGDLAVTSRWEQEANGFYTLETWTLTFRPQFTPSFQGTAWYDDGFGTWELTGSRILEDHRPGADCRTLEKETYSGEGAFFTEPHPDTDVSGSVGNLVMQNFFPQHAGNLGFEPLLHVVVNGHSDGTQYVFDNGTCVPSSYENDERFALEEAPGKVVTDGRGRVAVFDHHVFEDNSSPRGLDTYQVDVEGELAPIVG
jgi:hypothetical protein